ncbi:hypothetical protein PHLGIDRAFT_122457 [Phlebiopsis gigantea 11061_1 CR5-6]|uniref:Enoyl reductase (ER) domain-containing protein n=1 Tax=Phlebiopsis gigantea (strain 11061_1 CR5-6) TaxID=745531 RepID=A0A0C3ND52_PHLG1|nr:hypothetical protein PHLGIDRAFT_122457 [Phlebiopsis gigantea 11061_1 CR5-6]
MSPVTNARLLFREIPSELPDPVSTFKYDTSENIDIDGFPLHGGFLVRALAFSLDPYMRNRMRPEDTEGDMPAFLLNKVITGFGVGVVIRSESPDFLVGAHVGGFMSYQEYCFFGDAAASALAMPALGLTVLENPYNLPWRYFVGNLGMTGQTAYYALKDVSEPQKGETIFISAAAGAVGLMLVQLAVSQGLRVIASCGSDAKAGLLRELGAAHVINRKTDDIFVELKKAGPIDIFIDHVGGITLEAAIENAAMHARFVICGAVSTYNGPMSDAYGVKNLWLVNRYRITIRPLVVIDWHEKYLSEFYKTVPEEIAAGRLKCYESVYRGLQSAGQGFKDMLTGASTGKTVIVISEE